MSLDFVEKELSAALFRFSYGRLTVKQAEDKAKEVAPKLIENCHHFGHKSIIWYAQQLLAAI